MKRSMTVGRYVSRGFSLIDLMVSLAVIAILMALLLPAMKPVRETAKRLVCRSGVRQLGMGIAMYAEERNDLLPATQWTNMPLPKPMQTVYLRAPINSALLWDGLGRLYSEQFLRTPGIFYCPSHFGEFRLIDNLWRWRADDQPIIGNYQYRGHGPLKQKYLSQVEPKGSALVSDSLRHVDEYSHRVGANVLRADISVFWFQDTGVISGQLGNGSGEGGLTQAQSLNSFWNLFDDAR